MPHALLCAGWLYCCVLPFKFKPKRLLLPSLLTGIKHETAVQASCCAVLSAECFHYCSQLIMNRSPWFNYVLVCLTTCLCSYHCRKQDLLASALRRRPQGLLLSARRRQRKRDWRHKNLAWIWRTATTRKTSSSCNIITFYGASRKPR